MSVHSRTVVPPLLGTLGSRPCGNTSGLSQKRWPWSGRLEVRPGRPCLLQADGPRVTIGRLARGGCLSRPDGGAGRGRWMQAASRRTYVVSVRGAPATIPDNPRHEPARAQVGGSRRNNPQRHTTSPSSTVHPLFLVLSILSPDFFPPSTRLSISTPGHCHRRPTRRQHRQPDVASACHRHSSASDQQRHSRATGFSCHPRSQDTPRSHFGHSARTRYPQTPPSSQSSGT